MELAKIEKLLDTYFEGETTLQEEKILQDYFIDENLPTHLMQYKPIFLGMAAARQERTQKEFTVSQSNSKPPIKWIYMVASILVLAFLIGGVYLAQPNYSAEEQEALAAFEKSKKAMMLLSQNLNKGAGQLTLVNEFDTAKNKVFD